MTIAEPVSALRDEPVGAVAAREDIDGAVVLHRPDVEAHGTVQPAAVHEVLDAQGVTDVGTRPLVRDLA